MSGALAALLCVSVSGQESDITLPLTLNDQPRGEVFARVAGDDILLKVSDLESMGLGGTLWERFVLFMKLRGVPSAEGEPLISLRSAVPYLTFHFDEANLELAVIADARMLTPTTLDVAGRRPAGITYSRDTSVFTNYAVSTHDFGDVTAFVENGFSWRGHLFLNTLSRTPTGDVTRGITNVTLDERSDLRRWTIGDASVATDSLGGGTLLGGLTVSKHYGLDPYFVRYPGLGVRGTALTPAEVDIYLNGQLVGQTRVPPGQFELANLPATAGAGDLRVVIRDAFGREQIVENPFYYSTSILAKGLSEYTYSIGATRDGFGSKSFDYGDPVLLAYHRKGLTDSFTLGARIEGGRDLVSAGSIGGLRTRRGDFDLGLAGSHARGESGMAAQAGYVYLARRRSFGGRVRMLSRHYATTSLAPHMDRALVDASLFAATPIPHGSLTLQLSAIDNRDSADLKRLTLGTNITLTKSVSVFASAGGVDDGLRRYGEYFAGLSFHLGGNTTANLAVRKDADVTEVGVDVQRPLPIGTGYGYRLSARSSENDRRDGSSQLQYQTSFGRYEIGFDPFGESREVSLSASGGLIYQRGSFLFSRAVQDSFALVRVPGVPNVRVYASNQEIGRTNARGELLVPNLLSYYGNPLRINDQDIPLTYDVQEVEKVVAPPNRGGAFVEFPVLAIRAIGGSVAVRGKTKELMPSFGQITLIEGEVEHVSPLGRDGEFYFENLASGTYAATVEFEQGKCTFHLNVPAGTDEVVDLGRLLCTNEALR